MPRSTPEIAVIGAGAAGLACAERLAERGLLVQVYDKGRRPGGRIALRNRMGLRFEHGAPGFENLIERLSARVRIANRCRVTELQRTPSGLWRLLIDSQPLRGLHAGVVIALPPVQARTLLAPAPHLAALTSNVEFKPVLTALVGLQAPLGRAFRHIEFSDSSLADARRQSGGETDAGEGWVLHGADEFNRANRDCDPDAVATHLWQRFSANLGLTDARPVYLRGHRWQHARTVVPLGETCLHDPALALGLCGDWCLGDGVEDALASGRALADRMLGISEQPSRRSLTAEEGIA